MTGDVAVFQLDADVKLPPASQLIDKLTSCLPGDCCELQPSPLAYLVGQAQSFLTLIGWLQGSHHGRGVYRLASAASYIDIRT